MATTPKNLPHSWDLNSWPEFVWPNNAKRAQRVARDYRSELMAAGAVKRVGKFLVFQGIPYSKWIDRHGAEVIEFQSNNPEIGKSPHSRPGRPRKQETQAETPATT